MNKRRWAYTSKESRRLQSCAKRLVLRPLLQMPAPVHGGLPALVFRLVARFLCFACYEFGQAQ